MESLYDAATYHQLTLALDLGRTKATVRHYATYEKAFLQWLEQEGLPTTLDQLNRANVRACARWLADQPHAGTRQGATVPYEFTRTLHIFSAFLFKEELIPYDLLHGTGVPKVDQLERPPFNRTETLALIEVAGRTADPAGHQRSAFEVARNKAVVLWLFDTGVRADELCRLDVDSVNLVARTITVLGKGRRQRTVPFGDPTAADGGPTMRAVRAYLAERERLFERLPGRRSEAVILSHHGYRLTTAGLRQLFKRLGAQAGVPDCIPHKCRHSFCTAWLVQYPGDEAGLRRIAGHVSERVMQRYIHFSQLTLAERHGRGSPVTQWLGSRASPTHERPQSVVRLQARATETEDAVPTERPTQRTRPRPRVDALPMKPADQPDLAAEMRALQQQMARLMTRMEQDDA